MKIGYACLAVGVKDTNYRTCIMKNATDERLTELISHNLCSLENIIDYNIKNDIKLFRVTSDLIPFGSSSVNTLNWSDMFKEQFKKIAEKIKNNNMRISMHPGQYTVLNSPKEDVVKRAIEDLEYHTKVLENLGVGQDGKIILHIGGVYGDKESAIKKFIETYAGLDKTIKRHLVIENDDKSYTLEDVLSISKQTGIPVVFDNLHHNINSYEKEKSDRYWIEECKSTWKEEDGDQKIHYSQQDKEKRRGSHSKTIDSKEFYEFYKSLKRDDIDIMLEVKDKNLSAIKCINLITKDKNIKKLELEWSKYKYKILENSHKSYLSIRTLLKEKSNYPVLDFYQLIEDALQMESNKGNELNAINHIWGYFKDITTEKERKSFKKKLENFENDKVTLVSIKNILLKLAIKYDQNYLIQSYYFYI